MGEGQDPPIFETVFYGLHKLMIWGLY